MSATTWQEYMNDDSFRDELNNNAEAVKNAIQHSEPPTQKFRNLNDTKTIGLMTRSVMHDEIQITHHHTIRGSALTNNQE